MLYTPFLFLESSFLDAFRPLVLCARIYYVAFERKRYAEKFLIDLVAIWEGGIAIHGAIIRATLTGMIFTRVRNILY